MHLPKLQYCDKVEIHWVDIVSNPKWHSKEDACKALPANCSYVGYFLNKDKDCLRCMNMRCVDDNDCDWSVFPLGVITKINVLKKR